MLIQSKELKCPEYAIVDSLNRFLVCHKSSDIDIDRLNTLIQTSKYLQPLIWTSVNVGSCCTQASILISSASLCCECTILLIFTEFLDGANEMTFDQGTTWMQLFHGGIDYKF